MFMNKVMMDINMFSIRVCDWIISKGYTALIVNMDDYNCSLSEVKLFQQCLEPDSFLYSICRDNILSFNKKKSGYSWLFLKKP